MDSKTLSIVARVLFSVPFLGFIMGHFMKADEMAAMVGNPGGAPMVYVTGILMLAGVASILSGKMGMYGALGIAAMMLVFVALIHLPNWLSDNPMLQTFGQMGTLKDCMIAGGAIGIAALFAKDK